METPNHKLLQNSNHLGSTTAEKLQMNELANYDTGMVTQKAINMAGATTMYNNIVNNHTITSIIEEDESPETNTPDSKKKKSKRNDALIRISVCGSVYITTESTLAYFPETLLGSPEREDHFEPQLGMYYFNRNRSMFDAILYFYQSRGIFKPPSNIDEDVVSNELEFFKISLDDIFGTVEIEVNTVKQPTTLKQKIREFVNDPHYSRGACAWAIIDIVFICISLTLLVLETIPEIQKYFSDDTEPLYIFFLTLDSTVIAFFTVDIFLRMISWKNMLKFLTLPMHIMDLLSILPFFIGLVADLMSKSDESGKTHGYVALRVCRTFRIIRIFKFVRHSKELIVVMKVITGAVKEFLVLGLLILIFVLSCGTIMYYIESGSEGGGGSDGGAEGECDSTDTVVYFKSILEGCWWAVVTITTVGYGDVAPKTHLGRVFGSFVVVMGIVILALPMTIIVSKFSSSYDEEKRSIEKQMIERLRKLRDPEFASVDGDSMV